MARRIMARLLLGDPYMRVEVWHDGHDLKALGIYTLEEEGPHRWVFYQVGFNTLGSSYVRDSLQGAEAWGRSLGATHLNFGTYRSGPAMERLTHVDRSYSLHSKKL